MRRAVTTAPTWSRASTITRGGIGASSSRPKPLPTRIASNVAGSGGGCHSAFRPGASAAGRSALLRGRGGAGEHRSRLVVRPLAVEHVAIEEPELDDRVGERGGGALLLGE